MKEKMSLASEIIIALIVCIAVGASVYLIKNKTDGDLVKETTAVSAETVSQTQSESETDLKKGTGAQSSDKKDEDSQSEIIKIFAKEYYHANGVAGWYERFVLNDDASFKGQYHNWDGYFEGLDGHGEGSVNFDRKYSGKLQNIKKIDEYTYSADIVDFKAEGKLGSYTITKDKVEGEDHLTYNVVDRSALEGVTKIKLHLKGKPREKLEDYIISGVSLMAPDDEWSELPYNIITSFDDSFLFR